MNRRLWQQAKDTTLDGLYFWARAVAVLIITLFEGKR